MFWFLFSGVLAAAHGSNDGFAEQLVPELSLMQRQAAIARSGSSDTVPEPMETMEGVRLEQKLLSMIHTANQSGDASQWQNLCAIMLPLVSDMGGMINASKTQADAILLAHQEGFLDCDARREIGNNESDSMNELRMDRSNEHKDCRGRQAEVQDKYDDEQSIREGIEVHKMEVCTRYDQHANTNPSRNLVPNPEDYVSYTKWVQAVRGWAQTESNILAEDKELCENLTAELNSQEQKRGEFYDSLQNETQQCNNLQSSLETTTCSYHGKVEQVCSEHTDCHDSRSKEYNTSKAALEAQEDSLKREWWITQRIRCYLSVLEESRGGSVADAALEECQNKTHDTAFLALNWFSVPPSPSLCALPPKPCENPYLQEEYGSLPAKAPHADCTECATLPPVEAVGMPSRTTYTLLEGTLDTRTDNPVDIPNSELPVQGTEYSISLWIRAHGGNANYRGIYEHTPGRRPASWYYRGLCPGADPSGGCPETDVDLPEGIWCHVVHSVSSSRGNEEVYWQCVGDTQPRTPWKDTTYNALNGVAQTTTQQDGGRFRVGGAERYASFPAEICHVIWYPQDAVLPADAHAMFNAGLPASCTP